MTYIKKKPNALYKPKEIISDILYYFTLYHNKNSVQLTHIYCITEQLTLRCF